jgi:dihydropyrimidinase
VSVLLKNGLVVTASGSYPADVYVEGERIRAVGTGLAEHADEVVDASGKYILPGAIDPHTHIDMPYQGTRSSDDWTSGSIAAACGGTTTIIDFGMQGKGETLRQALDAELQRAEGKAVVDYGVHLGIGDVRPDVIEEMGRAVREYGTPSFKAYLFYDFRVSDSALIRLLEETKRQDGLLQLHAESYDMIHSLDERFGAEGRGDPLSHARAHADIAEEDAVSRALRAVELTGSRIYIVHLSSRRGLEAVRTARSRGIRAYAETCPQYLTLSEELYSLPDWNGAKYVMSPPLRAPADQDALWAGIRDGIIQTAGTDHCPFNFHGQKDMNGTVDWRVIPNGAPGIETMLMLMHSEGVAKGRISRERMVDILSTGTAGIFGLRDKGAIAPGKDADIVVFDPRREFTITRDLLHQRVDYTPWEGWKITGMPQIVYSRGRRVAEWAGDRMRFVGEAGRGRFIRRGPLFRES